MTIRSQASMSACVSPLVTGAGKIWKEWTKAQDAKGRPGSKMLKFVQDQVAKASM